MPPEWHLWWKKRNINLMSNFIWRNWLRCRSIMLFYLRKFVCLMADHSKSIAVGKLFLIIILLFFIEPFVFPRDKFYIFNIEFVFFISLNATQQIIIIIIPCTSHVDGILWLPYWEAWKNEWIKRNYIKWFTLNWSSLLYVTHSEAKEE